MPTPFSISAFPIRGYSFAEDVVCVNALVQSPLVVAGRPSSPWEDYNYKSLPKVSGCNLHSTQCSLDHLVRSDEAASPERT